jgi:hypothetical protein
MVQNANTNTFGPAQLADQIEQFIRVRTGGMIYNLRVEVLDDSVVLSGRTSTYYNKQLASHAAQSALEEQPLRNDIEVC